MKMFPKIAFALLAGAACLPCMIQGADPTCPSTISKDLCLRMEARSPDELVSFYVMLIRPPAVIRTDPRKDTAPPPKSILPYPFPDHEKYTRDMFGKYDLRWPEDTGNRASAPIQIDGIYRLFATKATILALGAETYVQEIQRWAPEGPVVNADPEYPAKVNLGDTTISSQDSLRFAPQTFGMELCGYSSKYNVTADASTGPTPHYTIRLTARKKAECALAAGYSGPVIILKNLPPGRHKLVFTDSSDFKLEIPDSVRITVIAQGSGALAAHRKGSFNRQGGAAVPRYTIDGRRIGKAPSASTRFGIAAQAQRPGSGSEKP